jgi:hypothetical protein
MDQRHQIELAVVDRLLVLRPRLIDPRATEPCAIDPRVIIAEADDAEGRLGDLAVEGEFLTQKRQRAAAVGTDRRGNPLGVGQGGFRGGWLGGRGSSGHYKEARCHNK